ncbi:MAG: hypothetical protein M0C28_15265 [Candidatus Moduliflexus flocculans]|nr:hypothetical protein [Candidatus Moduliflexus flocculans]
MRSRRRPSRRLELRLDAFAAKNGGRVPAAARPRGDRDLRLHSGLGHRPGDRSSDRLARGRPGRAPRRRVRRRGPGPAGPSACRRSGWISARAP